MSEYRWYPTPTRLALLRDVEAENIVYGFEEEEHAWYWVDPDPPRDVRKVTARIEEVESAGWVSTAYETGDLRAYPQLTDAGRQVLTEAGAR